VSPTWRTKRDWKQLKITRGALVVLIAQVVMSLLWVVAAPSLKADMGEYLIATPANVFTHGRVWTLVTSPLIEIDFVALVLSVLVMWMFVPTLERFWGTARFYRFVAITSIAGTVFGVLAGQLFGRDVPIQGLSPFVYAAVVAFGVIYARQPVRFFGVLPLTGRQLMFGFIGFLILFVTLQGFWEKGVSYAAAMVAAAVMTSKTWSAALALKRWRIARARAKLSVIEGGAPKPPTRPTTPRKKPDERFLN
jgi:membrane associated rhomboid family serine protease